MKYTLLKNKLTGVRSIYNSETKEKIKESENPALYLELRKKALNNLKIAEKNQCMRDLGLTHVKGACGGVYWE